MDYIKKEFGTLYPYDCDHCKDANWDYYYSPCCIDQLPCGHYRCGIECALTKEEECAEYWK